MGFVTLSFYINQTNKLASGTAEVQRCVKKKEGRKISDSSWEVSLQLSFIFAVIPHKCKEAGFFFFFLASGLHVALHGILNPR